jgi:hypothetical protein
MDTITQTQQFGGNKWSDLHHGHFTSVAHSVNDREDGWGTVPIWRFQRRQKVKKLT